MKAGDVIETPYGLCDQIIGPEGNRIKLGLLQPDKQVAQSFPLFTKVARSLSRDQIKDLVKSESRTAAREIFGPDTVDDQDGLGACQGFASAVAMEESRELHGQERVKLSGSYAYSLVSDNRDRGSGLAEGLRAGMENGYCPEGPNIPKWSYRIGQFPAEAHREAERFKGHEWYAVDTEEELATAVALGFVCVVAVHVGRGFSSLDRNGLSKGGNGVGNHAMLVDDLIYDDRLGEFKYDSKNSWKPSWGDGGRCYFTFDRHFRTTIRYHRFYVCSHVIRDPDGNNPPPLDMA